MLLSQHWQRFERGLRAKVDGGWILHQLTQTCKLDFFVVFSSIASVLGSPGQGNYAAANAFQDALACYRRGLGLPALSINWGPWSELGMAARLGADRGLQALSVEQALAALSALLMSEGGQVGVLSANWSRMIEQHAIGSVPPLLSNLVSTPNLAREPWLGEKLRAVPAHQWHEWLTSHVQGQVAELLELGPGYPVDVRRGLFDLGMDSLIAVELKNRLEAALGECLPATLAFEYPTIEAIAGFVADRVRGVTGAEPVSSPSAGPVSASGVAARSITPAASDADLGTLLVHVAGLSDDDALRLLLGDS
jgi:acyl carrier protein